MASQEQAARLPRTIEAGGISRLNLTLAISEYDHVRDLITGLIRPEGISLMPLNLEVEEIFSRYIKNLEFDVAETSFGKYISLTAAGHAPMVAIPVFPSRVHRHSSIYVRSDRALRQPKDLEGRRVGIPEWAQTAGIYMRGILAEFYGVDLRAITWVQSGVNSVGRGEKVELHLPAGIVYEPRHDKSLSDMLMAGEIDAIITAREPACFMQQKPECARMFANYRGEEEKCYRASGVFPIMHVVTLRRVLFEQYPWTAMNLFSAFEAAKNASVARLRDIAASRFPLPWGAAIADELAATTQGDLWPYGMEENRTTLEAFCRYAHDQGVTRRRVAIEELFPVEVRTRVKV